MTAAIPGEFAASLTFGARVFGLLLFGTALAGKIRRPRAFAEIIAAYGVIPPALGAPAAAAIMILEGAVVLSLASGVALVAGGALAITLLLGFAVAMTLAMAGGAADIDCGCSMDAQPQRVRHALVARNAVLALLIAPALASAPVAGLQPMIDGLGWGGALFLLNAAFGQLLALQDSAERVRRRFS